MPLTEPADDERLVPMFEYLIPMEGMPHSQTVVATLRTWLNLMAFASTPPPVKKIKAPAYWFRMKEEQGTNAAGVAVIWSRHYDRNKQLLTWASAPPEDFLAAGYARETWVNPRITRYKLWLEAQG